MNNIVNLLNKIKEKKVIVGIFGLGYVGLPLAFTFANKGIKVIGFDISKERVDTLNNGKTYIESLMEEGHLKEFTKNGNFRATHDFEKDIPNIDVAIICVPTPLDKYHQPDLSFLVSTINPLAKFGKKGIAISLESTTYPGTTEEVMLPPLQKAGFTAGEDLFLIYSPEREDPGNINFKTNTIPKLVSGVTKNCLEVGKAIYEVAINKVVPCKTVKVAEMAKLLENIHRCINISMINEMKIVADKMGINILDVIDAAATKPFGFTAYYPGPGIGGHCIPVDPFYLTWKAKEFGIHANFIELAGEMNFKVQDFVVEKTVSALNMQGKPANGAKILVLGVAYKKNISDYRESPSLNIIQKLSLLGANVTWHDPFVEDISRYNSCVKSDLNLNIIKGNDLILILTNHDGIDYELIKNNAKMIVDTRGVYREEVKNIISA